MAVAAEVAGDAVEARFWRALPPTLDTIHAFLQATRAAAATQVGFPYFFSRGPLSVRES